MSDLLFEVERWLWHHPRVELVLQVGIIVWAIRGTYLFVNRYILKRR